MDKYPLHQQWEMKTTRVFEMLYPILGFRDYKIISSETGELSG